MSFVLFLRAAYVPGDGETSPAYSSQSVQCLYINHLLSVNKLVLSYLLLCLLPQWSLRPFFCPTVASNSYSSWDECPSNLWTLPTFSELANMCCDDLTSPVAAAATAQVKLCPYDEENRTFGSASSRPSLQRQESNHKNSNMPTP